MKAADADEGIVPAAARERSVVPGISRNVFFHAFTDAPGAVVGPLLAFGVPSALSGDLLIFAGVSTLFAAVNSREAFLVLRSGNHDVRQ